MNTMLRRASLVLSMFVLAAALPSSVLTAEDAEDLIIRISSTSPDEQITFEGSYVYRADGHPFRHVKTRTPFVAHVSSDIVHGMFRAKHPDASLSVEVIDISGGDERVVSWTTGRVVVLGRNSFLPNATGFITGY